MYRGNPQYELYCLHQQNNGKTVKANEEQDFCFCGGSEKSRLKFLLNFSYEEELTFSLSVNFF